MSIRQIANNIAAMPPTIHASLRIVGQYRLPEICLRIVKKTTSATQHTVATIHIYLNIISQSGVRASVISYNGQRQAHLDAASV